MESSFRISGGNSNSFSACSGTGYPNASVERDPPRRIPFVAAMAASRTCRCRKKDVKGPVRGAGFQKWEREACWSLGAGLGVFVGVGAGGCG